MKLEVNTKGMSADQVLLELTDPLTTNPFIPFPDALFPENGLYVIPEKVAAKFVLSVKVLFVIKGLLDEPDT